MKFMTGISSVKARIARYSYLWLPIPMGLILLAQVVFKPINFLFADDWLLLKYLTPNVRVEITDLLQLVNGHNVLISKVLLVAFSTFFPGNQITAFSILNVCLATLASILISHKYFRDQSMIVIFGFILLFFNLKQSQNYNMIISGHFIQSLFCISLYLFFLDTNLNKYRWIPLTIAPFTGGFGLSLLFLEPTLLLIRKKLKPNKYDLIALTYVVVILFVSYILQYATKNQIFNNDPINISQRIFGIIEHPWFLPSYWLGILSGPFVPSSKIMLVMSQAIGCTLLCLIVFLKKQLLMRKDLLPLFLLQGITIVQFTFSGYTGTFQSVTNGFSNRYVTGTVFGLIIFYLAILNVNNSKTKITLAILLCAISALSGIKSGLEWIQVRSSQSIELRALCSKSDDVKTNGCLEISKNQSFFQSSEDFEVQLQIYLSTIKGRTP